MPRTPRMSVPQRAVPALTWLAKLSGQEFSKCLESLSAEEPARSRQDISNRLQNAIPGTEPSRGNELVREIFGLFSLHASHGWEIESIAARVASDQSVKIDDELRPQLQQRIESLLSNPLVLRIAEAYDISGDHYRVFHTGRVLTDVRPVFSEDSEIVGAVIVHTLKLGFFTANGSDECYVALDDEDLLQLERAVAQAKEKSKALGQFISSAGLADLTGSAE